MGFGGGVCNAVSGQGGGIGSAGYVSLCIYGNTFIGSCGYTAVWVDVGSIPFIYRFLGDGIENAFIGMGMVLARINIG